MSDSRQERVGRTFLISGTVGLIAALVTNLVAVMVFHKSSAAFFSSDWWSQWFPAYCVWPTFLIIGFALSSRRGTHADNRR